VSCNDTGGTIPPSDPKRIAEMVRRIKDRIAAEKLHMELLERIGPLDMPYPMPQEPRH